MENRKIDGYKLVIIHGDVNKDKFSDGQIDYYGTDFDFVHSQHLLDYAKENYGDVKIFNSLNPRHTADTIGFFFIKFFNDIIFFNTTKNVDRDGYSGSFLFPDHLTDAQVNCLYEFVDTIDNYYISSISDSLKLDDGIVVSNDYYPEVKSTPREVLDNYFKSKFKGNTR